MFDIAFSFLVIVVGMPLWLLVALIIKLESKGPVFYTQPRVGKNEKIFKIFKFRSMVKDADRQKQKWTSVNDPRVTSFGRFIRKTHLDEIPQFWNVLRGDMSIVGPRPEQPRFVEQFSQEIPYYKRRLKVRPGITGWWQVKYSAHILDTEEIENRLKDDFYYIENMSLRLDIEIVIRTVWCVIAGHGQA
jgi:exopolysaccharide biosynthesis polyprenyl glycosylphosphotransferase